MIVQELRLIQERHGYLPDDDLRELAQLLNVPLHRVHEVASFYPLFRRQSPCAVEVKVCRDMACHLAGATAFRQDLEALAREIGGDKVRVGGVSCLGQCDRPVAVSLNDHHVHRGMSAEEVRALVRKAANGESPPHQDADVSPLGWKIDPYNGKAEYRALRRYLDGGSDADALLKELETANLRGMGGAGFPTFRKWAAVRAATGEEKYVICNADESEPGTFKDRELLRRAPHLLLEGLTLACLVTGTKKGTIYIRHEYHDEIAALERALADSGLPFPIDLFVSPGGYIQGEESAMLEAMEDRRGEPRNKPPFPVTHGLFNKPTVINNVETLCWVPSICLHGGTWYRDQGVNGATGLRLVSVCGDVQRPGVYEVPFGQTVRDLILECAGGLLAGRTLKAIATSGPSGGFLPARIAVKQLPAKFAAAIVPDGAASYDILDLTLDFNTLSLMGGMLGAAFVVYDDRRDMLEQALNCTEFFRNESCGKCVPCRVGSEKMVELIGEMLGRRFARSRLPLVGELGEAMRLTSICGLGQVAANPLASVITHFPQDLANHGIV
jgi:NADH:ubiquinone oxidoreductase subunit F (NADH-binding)/NADH:ubiquinone oxidoreductase subunit E